MILSRVAKKKKKKLYAMNIAVKVVLYYLLFLMFGKEKPPSIKGEMDELDKLERESFSQKSERWEREEERLKEELAKIEKRLAKMPSPSGGWTGVVNEERYFELSNRAADIRNQLSGLSPNPIRDRFMRHGRSNVQGGGQEKGDR
jgi:hypothetical protein